MVLLQLVNVDRAVKIEEQHMWRFKDIFFKEPDIVSFFCFNSILPSLIVRWNDRQNQMNMMDNPKKCIRGNYSQLFPDYHYQYTDGNSVAQK